MAKPVKLTIRTYDVGFGDCFLLTFHYSDFNRNVLIDFGSMEQPEKNVAGSFMEAIAQQIKRDCGNKLDAVIATHRHQDHISGFSMNKGKGPGKIIRDLKPDVVLQPWTEDPRAPKRAIEPPGKRLTSLRKQMLLDMHAVSARVIDNCEMLKGQRFAAMRTQLRTLGMDNIKNASAVKNLMSMGKKQVYAYHGSNAGLKRILPGVEVKVLGPPTVKQTDTILEQRRKDPDEFWHLNGRTWSRMARLAKSGKAAGANLLFPGHAIKHYKPWSGRWYRNRAMAALGESLLSIVRTLDDAMNNTSLILLFKVNGKKILFPGDAQYENWMFALSKKSIRDELADVDVYKVGHHGSLNATPKTLWNGFSRRGSKTKADRLMSFLSTREHVHGSENNNSEVPRSTLLAELEEKSTLCNTSAYNRDELVRATEIAL